MMNIEVKILLDHYYHLVNNYNNFKTMKPWQCYEKAQDIKEKIRVLKEDYKDNQELYDLLTEFCDNEYNLLGVKWDEKT
jgi:hypothetical protein